MNARDYDLYIGPSAVLTLTLGPDVGFPPRQAHAAALTRYANSVALATRAMIDHAERVGGEGLSHWSDCLKDLANTIALITMLADFITHAERDAREGARSPQ